MILQYKGFNNNWTYEETDSITISTVEITKATVSDGANIELSEADSLSKKIDQEIREATNCINTVYITEKPVYMLGYVKIAILYSKNKEVTYVFDMNKEVYLLSNNGKTVKKL